MYLNINGELKNLSIPLVMGILNLTPDSFFSNSRKQTEKEIISRIFQLKEEGADIIDVGGYSSRPDAEFVSKAEEMRRLDYGLKILLKEYPEAIVSVDTFRSDVAKKCVEEYGVAMINDISAGELDEKMYQTVADLQVPYIIMHMKGNPQTMMKNIDYKDFHQEILFYFSEKIEKLKLLGINDIIIDPGFGFSKTTEHNYQLMNFLEDFHIFGLPLLVGISRKRMIRDVLNCSIEESLNGTTILNTFALMKGANVIRVHDVKEAVQAVRLLEKIKKSN